MSSDFPKDFLWGAALSAHQSEGNNHNDWTEWEKLGRVKHGQKSGRAAGHYERYAQDFQLAKELGHNAHRLSIEWSRIFPKPGVVNTDEIDHYRHVLEELHRLHIEPIVTLHHFTNPLWVSSYGGWTNSRVIDDFGQYVMLIVKEFGPLIKYWITINEPTVYTSLGYVQGYWPPEQVNYWHGWRAIRIMADAHELAYQIIHRHFPSAKVGVANNLGCFTAVRPHNPLDRGLRWLAEYWHNQWWLDQTHQSQDFIGLNYYFRHPLKFRFTWPSKILTPQTDPNVPKTDVGWEIYPAGLGKLLRWLSRYDRPIIITENGLADAHDSLRAKYLHDHLQEVRNAIQAGADVRGYMNWSLLDNFEWREGFDPRFGLIEVDYKTMERKIRPSALVYKNIIQNGLKD